MEPLDEAHETLDAMLGYLGFIARIEIDAETSTLNVATNDGELLIGAGGERLEDIQHLVNRIVIERNPDAPRILIDIENFRANRDLRLIEEAEELAARVISSGKPLKLEPMNSYQRRLIHNHFKECPSIRTWSPADPARLKRITLSPR